MKWQVIGADKTGREVTLQISADSEQTAIAAAKLKGVTAARAVQIPQAQPSVAETLPLKPGQVPVSPLSADRIALGVAVLMYISGTVTAIFGATGQTAPAVTIAAIVLGAGAAFHMLSVLMRILRVIESRPGKS